MELTERITGRVTGLACEVELLRRQLADAEHELERLEIAGRVIAQLTADAGILKAAGQRPERRAGA
jgi:hypothetical protein